MRESIASCASIKRTVDGHTQWLTQWNSHWKSFNLVGGHKREGETFEECLVREIEEELELTLDRDYHISDTAPASLEFTEWSKRAGQMTSYQMRVFHVELMPEAIELVSTDSLNRWLNQTEVLKRITQDSRPVSTTVAKLLDAIGDLRSLRPPVRRRNL